MSNLSQFMSGGRPLRAADSQVVSLSPGGSASITVASDEVAIYYPKNNLVVDITHPRGQLSLEGITMIDMPFAFGLGESITIESRASTSGDTNAVVVIMEEDI